MINIRVLLVLLSSIILVTSCEKIDLGKEISVKIGERHNISRNLSFKIDSINDYRCPSDVTCIWAGDTDLYFDFGTRKKVINLYNSDTNPYLIDGYTIEILDVLPYPTIQDGPSDPNDVLILLKVDK